MPLFHMVSDMTLRIVLESHTYATIVFGQHVVFQDVLKEIFRGRYFCKTRLLKSIQGFTM